MWIQTSHTGTDRLYDADVMDEPVEFSENGTAQVTESVGQALIDKYDTITTHD